MTAEKFWTGWLKITMLLVIMAGLTLLTLYHLGYTKFIDAKFDQLNEGKEFSLAELQTQIHWMIHLGAGIMILWGGSMLYIAGTAFKEGKKWAWRIIFFPVLIWYIVDNSISLYYGVLIDLTINTILFFQLVAPLLFLRNQFFPIKNKRNEKV